VRALVIAQLTFREALRKKMIWGVLLLSIGFVVVYYWGFTLVRDDFLRSNPGGATPARGTRPILTLDLVAAILVSLGYYTINFLAGVMTIFAAVGAVSSEVEAGTFQAVVPKPLARWEIIVGKYLGFAGMIALYIALMAADVVVTSRLVTGYAPANYLGPTALVVLVSLILLALTILGSTVLPTMANGVVVFMLYGMALLGGLLEQVGSVLLIRPLETVGLITSLLLPSDVIWQLANTVLRPDLSLRLGGPIPIATAAAPSQAMVNYALGYVVAMLAASVLVFRRKDL
jgi:ABC-type transport system involved in multi-copper enzyme maturation permease subunit